MQPLLEKLVEGIQLTGDTKLDMAVFLTHHDFGETAGHSTRVAAEAKRIADRFRENTRAAEAAGWLHDISAVFPAEQRTRVARELGVEVLPEEDAFPMIIHQKLSAVMAGEIFAITDRAVLSAIGCHTTLKANSSRLDKVLFIADKIKWDGEGEPPFLEGVLAELERSLGHAAFYYIDYLWQRRDSLQVVHPWLAGAHAELSMEMGRDRKTGR